MGIKAPPAVISALDARAGLGSCGSGCFHEAGLWKQDPRLVGRADEPFPNPNSRGTRGEARIIAEHHTDPAEAGRIFEKVKPKLAVFSHYNAGAPILPLVRQSYSGPVELGEDGMTIDIGGAI